MKENPQFPKGSSFHLPLSQRLDWLQLIRTEGIGPRTFRLLVNRFGSAAAALEALPVLFREKGRPLKVASRTACEDEIVSLERMGAYLLAVGEAEYPAALRALDPPPPLLAVWGCRESLEKPAVAVVGSRNASGNGLAFAEKLARDLAVAGYVTISGLARGIDARVHRACLSTGTVAVLAGGLDRIYPSENSALAEKIREHGALVTEMPLGWEPRGRDFPRRNRLVSGLALGTVIVEAARRSGSLITARFALEQGREVFAVPGSPLDLRAEGTNDLLRQGATLCASSADVIEVLTPLISRGFTPSRHDLKEDEASKEVEPLWEEIDLFGPLQIPETLKGFELDEETCEERELSGFSTISPPSSSVGVRLMELLGPSPLAVNDLVRLLEVPIAEINAVLFELELQGEIERADGSSVARLIPGIRDKE